MANNSFINYYEVLECDQSASIEELKKCYQRLVLSSHPDKSNTSEDKFLLIQKAWSILRDPESRKKYDATLACQKRTDYLLYDIISLSDMTFHESSELYSFRCRCGGIYLMENNDYIPDKVLVECEMCSLYIQVNKYTDQYFVV